jgi:hypothetical protein
MSISDQLIDGDVPISTRLPNGDGSISDQLTNGDAPIPARLAGGDAAVLEVGAVLARDLEHVFGPGLALPMQSPPLPDRAQDLAPSPISAARDPAFRAAEPAAPADPTAPRPAWPSHAVIRGLGAHRRSDVQQPDDPPPAQRPPRRRDGVGDVRLHSPETDAPPPMPAPPSAPPGAALLVRVSGEERRETGDLALALAVTQPGGQRTAVVPHRVRLRGNRLHFIRHLAEVARKHASVPADCPVRLLWQVDD